MYVINDVIRSGENFQRGSGIGSKSSQSDSSSKKSTTLLLLKS